MFEFIMIFQIYVGVYHDKIKKKQQSSICLKLIPLPLLLAREGE
jgi:hypothetical protein